MRLAGTAGHQQRHKWRTSAGYTRLRESTATPTSHAASCVTRGSLSSCCVTFARFALAAVFFWLSSLLCWSWMVLNTRKLRSAPADSSRRPCSSTNTKEATVAITSGAAIGTRRRQKAQTLQQPTSRTTETVTFSQTTSTLKHSTAAVEEADHACTVPRVSEAEGHEQKHTHHTATDV